MLRISAFVLALLCAAGGVRAAPAEQPPAFMRYLYPPELVMRHQRRLVLADGQREAITEAIRQTQSEVVEIQWQLRDLEGKVEEIFATSPIDEKAALDQITRLLDLEERVKKSHLRLLIRIRNQLNDAQREQLDRLRQGS